MTDPAVPVVAAARELSCSPATLRRWLRAGAPCVQPGGHGPGRSARVVVADVERWRRGEPGADLMQRIGVALVDVLRRDGGEGVPAHRSLNIPRRPAAALLAIAYERIYRAMTGNDAKALPAEIEHAVRDLTDSRA